MLKFYFSKASSAVAAHILLEDVCANYEAIEVSIPEGQHRTPVALARNPKGRIPVLETVDGILTENPAIVEYVAASHASANMLPVGIYQQARARSLCAYLCATAHVAFAHRHRGARWATLEASLQDMQNMVPGNIAECAEFLEQDLPLAPWAMGAQYTFCDPYLYMFSKWLGAANVKIDAYPKLHAHRDKMTARPATQKVLSLHGLA